MNKNFLHRGAQLLLVSLLFVCSLTRGAEEVMVKGLSGTNIAATTLSAEDQWYNTMLGGGWSSTFCVASSKATVHLHFDDTKRKLYSAFWKLKVDYDITVYDQAGASTTTSAESLEINFDPAANYTDKALRTYSSAHKATITITSVTLKDISNNPITAFPIPADAFLDLQVTTERFYVMSGSTPTCTTATGFTPGNPANKELPLVWPYIQGAESYDLELLFVDVGGATTGNFAYDMANATRINVSSNNYNAPLAYSKGTIIYRVRGVGRDCSGNRTESAWSMASTGNTATYLINTEGASQYHFAGLDPGINWQYGSAFAEDGKRKETMGYFDGSLRSRQSLTQLSSDKNVIIGESKYDYEGRGTVQILPSPTLSSGMHFYNNFNPSFDRTKFDTDAKIVGPDAMSSSGGSGNYYSTSNTNNTGVNAYIPDAQGYPYTQTRFMNDGTGRPRATSGVGYDHKLGSGKETEYFYGTPNVQEEIDRLFGNNVGYVSHYKKNMVEDANGQVSVSYLDQYGRTIATALAGTAPANLLAIDSRNPSASTTITGSLLGNNNLNQNQEMVSVSTLMVAGANTPYTFIYGLTNSQYCDDCLEPSTPTCKDCKYDLEIKVTDRDGNLATGGGTNPITLTASATASYTFSYTFNTGTYTVTKTLRPSKATYSTYRQQYIDNLKDEDNEDPCVAMPAIDPEPCGDCNTNCLDAFTRRDQNGNLLVSGSDTLFFDQVGNSITETAGKDSVAKCKALTCAPAQKDLCDLKYEAMLADMTPGGQYFDNTPYEYIINATTGELEYNPTWVPNDWLNTYRSNSSGWFNSTFHASIDNWQEVRDNWNTALNTGWGTIMVALHPEKCAYDYFCSLPCKLPEPQGYTGAAYDSSYAFDQRMLYCDGTNGYTYMWNPLGLTTGGANGITNDNSTYIAQTNTVTANRDDYFEDNSASCMTCASVNRKNRMTELLQKFIPVRDGSGTFTGNYYSLWYLLDDPDGLANCTTATCTTNVHSSIRSAFDEVKNNLNTKYTKFQLFRGFYTYAKQAIIAQEYQYWMAHGSNSTCSAATTGADYTRHYLETKDLAGNLTTGGYQVRFPENTVLTTYMSNLCGSIDTSFFGTIFRALLDTANNRVAATCTTNCERNADAMMAKLTCVSAGHQATMRAYLLGLCEKSCDADHPEGQNTSSTSVSGSWGSFTSIQALIDHYNTVVNTSANCLYVYNPPTEYNQARCQCDNLKALIAESGCSSTDYSCIATAVNDAFQPTTAYTSTDIQNWLTECNSYTPSVSDLNTVNFPDEMDCDTEQPDPSGTLTNLATALEDACDDDAEAFATYQAQVKYDKEVEAAATAYVNAFMASCLAALPGKETFTVEYPLNEYQYTLYYYDQAGNLVQTVPPKGVKVLTNLTDFNNVKTYRSSGGTPVFPDHDMASRYGYNSLNQVKGQVTPDAYQSRFWYDALGRLAVSQSSKQRTGYSPAAYSYTLYDALGRITEVGQLQQSTAMTDATAKDPSALATWIAGYSSSSRVEVTKTFYDESPSSPACWGSFSPVNLRNRVARTIYQDVYSASNTVYDHATHYSYDIHGNVNSLVQQNNVSSNLLDCRQVDYTYDLVSGNVNEVHYQTSAQDQFHHRYYYDADNRITSAYTSRDGVIWEKDAKYFYYAYGPLSRTEVGDKQVQGTDYMYTIHGWIKGVNSNTLQKFRDPGKDGIEAGGLNMNFASDAHGYSLGYFAGDYKTIGTFNANCKAEASTSATNTLTTNAPSLYNGNISHMVTALLNTSQSPMTVQGSAFKYDQLNRIKSSNIYTEANLVANNAWSNSAVNNNYYKEEYTYDNNGNILELDRRENAGNLMDDLNYTYYNNVISGSNYKTNKLNYIDDAIGSGSFSVDIDDQANLNYAYDSTGNMISDAGAYISAITWNAYGKIKTITGSSSGSSNTPDMLFGYDASGNRISKEVRPRTAGTLSGSTDWYTYYYVRDAQGNILATYKKMYDSGNWKLFNLDDDLYGSSRLGTVARNIDLSVNPAASNLYTRNLGNKQYECSNHLGNVTATISDRRLANDAYTSWAYGMDGCSLTPSGSADGIIDGFSPDVISATDYYNFGMPQPGRTYSSSSYRFGMNGQEKDDEITGQTGAITSAEYWEYDSRSGRRWNTDPIMKPWESPYACFNSNPIWYADPSGLDGEKRARKYQAEHGGTLSQSQKDKGKWFVDGLTPEGKGFGTMTKVFQDNIFERVGKSFVGGLRRMENSCDNAFSGPAFEGVRNLDRSLDGQYNGHKAPVFIQVATDLFPPTAGVKAAYAMLEKKDLDNNESLSNGEVILEVAGILPFGAFAKITKPVILTYKAGQVMTKGFKGALQAHHIVEVRHLQRFGLSVADAPAMVITAEEHAGITKVLNELLPTGVSYTKEQVLNAYKQAYKDFPELYEAAATYLSK